MFTNVIRSIFTTNFALAPEESVLIFTDTVRDDETIAEPDLSRRQRLRDIALLMSEIGRTFTKRVAYVEYPALSGHGVEPPVELWQAAFGKKAVTDLDRAGVLTGILTKTIDAENIEKAASILKKHANDAVHAVIAVANFSTSHTRFREFLTTTCGARYASMPLFDASMFEGPMCIDWKELAKKTRAIAKTVSAAETVTVTTPDGTKMTFSKKGRAALPDTGMLTKPGAFSNLPAGEVFFAPVEGSAHGTMVLNWAPTRELATPITVTVRQGLVTAVTGDEPYAEVLRQKLDERPENRNIAELGIGTNSRARRPDNILESEKILGTIHIAMGDNSAFGGIVKTPFHQDFVFFKPTITLTTADGRSTVLMKNGHMADHPGA